MHLWSGDEYGGQQTIKRTAPVGEPPVFYRKDWEGADTFKANLAGYGIDVP